MLDRSLAARVGGELFLICPRCRLSMRSGERAAHSATCPRCRARAGVPVELFCSRLPASELYGEGPAGEPAGRLAHVEPRHER